MKSSTPNCNSNDQLLQLVSIQLLQKAYFRQFMFEGSYYFTVFLPYAGDFPSSQVTTTAGAGCRSVLVRQFPHLAAKLADRDTNSRKQLIEQCNQCQKLPEPVHDRLTTSSSVYCCRVLAAEACCQPPVCCCPTGGTGCHFCSSITGFH